MDRISGLSDDLLVKILSFLPTKVAVSTCFLSKRWECLWMWLPKLEFPCNSGSEESSLRCFLNRNLPLHRASVLESFCLDCSYLHCKPEDVRLWIVIAVSRCLHELNIRYCAYPEKPDILPSSLYACKSLAVLKLAGDIVLDVPRMVSLPSLKTLQLDDGTSIGGESLQRLLSICPVLETLSMEFYEGEDSRNFIVIVPSLQSLSLCTSCDLDGLKIDTPSLKYLKLDALYAEEHSCSIKNLPNLEEAYVHVNSHVFKRLIKSITSVKRLTLCSEALYGTGIVFNQLEHFKLCDCCSYSSNVLARLLKVSPNLRVLEIFQMIDHEVFGMGSWNQPSTIPKSLRSSLQTFSWSGYEGSPDDIDVAVYILKNARCLKIAKFSSDSDAPKLKIPKELSFSSRASTTCQLVFD